MQTTPRSAKTMAPASRLLSPNYTLVNYYSLSLYVPESLSVVTAAVSPTPVEPRPVVATALGAVCSTYLNISNQIFI